MTHWTDFVKDYSKKHKITYKEALKDANCSSEYHKSKGIEKFVPVQDLAGNFVPVKNENISMTITEIKKRGRPKKYFTQEEAKKAKISKTIAGAKKRKQKGEGIIDDVKNLASKFGSFVTGTAKKIKDTAVALVEGRNDYPPKVRDIISKYGDKIITGITINRTPLGKPLMTALQIASGNTFSQKLQNTPYDKLFHLFMCVEFANGKITLEKNEVINGEDGCKLPKDTESKIIDSSSIPNGLSLTDALNKTKERMGGKFFVYSAKDNNCQDFLSSFLQANNIGNSNDISWIKQETKVLFEGNDRLRKIANTLTDIGARVDILKQGVGAKKIGFGLKSKKGGMMGNANVTPLTHAQGNSIIDAFNGTTHQIRLNQLQTAIANIQGGNVRERFRNYALITGGASVANFYMRTYDAILAFEQDGATDTEGAGLKSGTFTRQLKEFNRANKKNLDLHSFAMMVLANPDKFNEITKKRARFYINIVLKKGGMMPQNLFPPLQQQPNQLTPLTQQQTMDIAQAINTFRSPQVADSVGRTDFADAIRGINNVLPRFRLGLQTHYGNLTIRQIENYVTGPKGATELYSQFNVGGKIGGALRDDVDFMFNYIETNFLQDRPDVVSYINTLDDDERISMVLNYIKDDNGDISRAVNMMEEGNFTFELSNDINNLVNELILIGNDEGANTDSETRSIEGGALSDTDAIVMALGSAGGLFVLNELYKFAYNRIMGNRPVPPPVANFIIARPVPNGIPRAIARVVQRELVPAHYAVYPHEYSAPLADVEVRDIETGRGQGKSKVKVAPEPTKVAPEPEEEYSLRPPNKERIEQKRMANEDPLITETLRKRAELKNILKETLGGTGNKKSHTNNIGKMANSWIMYVKDFAKKNNMKYNEALKSPACKAGYRKGKEGMGFPTKMQLANSGLGMPTSREEFAAEQYDQRNLGANGKVILN
jgi:hypothetical protein